jgi:DNA modification methylase
MIYYSFYLDAKKTQLVYRTDDGYNTEKFNLKMFESQGLAQSDYFKLLYDNEDYRFGQYFDTDIKVKKTSSTKKKIIHAPKPIIERKIYDTLQPNTIYHEKCEETMSRMPDGYVDLTITSPPYNAGNRSGIGDDMYNEYCDDLSQQEYEAWLFRVIDELLRVTKRHVFLNIQMLGNNKLTVLEIFGRYKHKIKDRMVWNKNIAPPHISPGVMNSKFEDRIILSNINPHSKKFDDAIWNQGSFNNVIEGRNASSNKYAKFNKATFPSYLPRTILNHFGTKDDLVYDPFTGTGTTPEACIIEQRSYIGSEMDGDQCKITNQRLINEVMAKRIEF